MNRMIKFVAVILVGAGLARAVETEKAKAPGADLAAARKELLGLVAPTQTGVFEETPTADGAYIYEAPSAKPIVEGGQCQVESDKIVKGLTLVKSAGAVGLLPDQRTQAGVFWTLKNIKKGPYWIGVLYQGSGAVGPNAPLVVYLNGRIVQLGCLSNPVQVAPGAWFIQAHAANFEFLNPGDEIALAFSWGGTAARLILHQKEPVTASESPWKIATDFGGTQWNQYTALGVSVEGRFLDKAGKAAPNLRNDAIQQTAASVQELRDEAGKVMFRATLANPLAVPVTVDYTCVVKTFYGETVARDAERVTLQPHARISRDIPFEWQPSELTHFADLVLLGVNPPDLSKPREDGGLGWPRHEALAFFPGHRQTLPWPDPFNARVVRRITLDNPYGGSHHTYTLDGSNWEMGYTPDLEPPMPAPADITFRKSSVPRGWHGQDLDAITPRPHGAYFRRSMDLPDDLSGRSFKLNVQYVYDEATAYVNGIKVGNVRGDSTPLICDITKALKPGKNELVIVVRDLIALMNPDYVDKENPVANPAYLDAPGLHGAHGPGIGSVKIESAPLVSSEDVFVKTSVRNKKITVRATMANRGTGDIAVKARAEVLDDGKPILDLGERDLTLRPDQPVDLEIEQDWDHPQLWGPGNPYLYAMRVTLTDAKTGDVLDVRRDRFGFRESWIDGPNIFFNGIAIRPVGYQPITRFSPKGDFMLKRGGGADWLDEVGIICYKGGISGVYNTSSPHNVANDKFWQAAEENSIRSIKTMQNSPHIVAWDISNEWLCFLHYSSNDLMAGARRFKALSDAVKRYDPSRWTLGNAEGDFYGLHDNHSLHYAKPYFGSGNESMHGHSEYLPDSAFWRKLDEHFTPGQDIQLSPFHKTLLNPWKKVVMDNEYLWKVGDYMPPGPSAVAGEDDVVSPAIDNSSGPIAWMWKTLIDGHRDMGMALVNIHCSWLSGVTRGGFLPQTFIMPENQHHGYAGARQTRTFTLLNGLFHTAEMKLAWTLTSPDGKIVENGEELRNMVSGDIQRGAFSFTLPELSRKGTCTLTVTLEADGEFACGEEWDIEVWPGTLPRVAGLQRSLFLYDPEGSTAATFEKLALTFTRLNTFSIPPGDPASALLVIGEHALDQDTAKAAAALADFVDQAGKVFILGQNHAPANLPVATKLSPDIWASQVFVRAGSHPIMEGITSYDLHFWQGDRAAGRGAYTKPNTGNFVVLADSGNWISGLDRVNLMEAFRGKGSYILCQMPLVSKFDIEPMAMELLSRTIVYMAGSRGFKTPDRTLKLLTSPDSALASKMKSARVEHQIIDARVVPDGASSYMIDAEAARQLDAAKRAQFAASLREGAKIAVVGIAPEDQDWLRELAGIPLSITVQPYPLWDGRGFRKGWSDYSAGLSQIDLYWKRFSGSERANGQAEQSDNIIEWFQDYSVRSEEARELIFPGALVEVDGGKGVLLLDQRRWTTQNEELLNLAARNIASLMTALDVNIAPYVQPRELPEEIDFKTIDLRPFANRALVDESAKDGYGGWPDQGPNTDMREFPTGKHRFKGVPFDIGEYPKSCIMLASLGRPRHEELPTSVEIPVGFPAEGFYFMHASAGTGRRVLANYRIQYADGTFVDIPLEGGKNIHDWANPRPLENEEGTTSIVGWTGKNKIFPVIGTYRMLWVNEKPDVPVKSIVYSTPDMKSLPVLIGLTAAVRKGQFAAPPEDVAKAKRLTQEGRAAFAAGRLEEARTLCQAALALDPAQPDVYQVLADTAEKKGDEDWLLEAYRAWIYSGPRTPMPYNRIAEILEKRKDFKGALEHYRESLQVEWNQPPVIEAVRRLDAGL